MHAIAANAVFGRRSELWCNYTDEGRSPRSQEVPICDRIASIDDHSAALGGGLFAELGSKCLCHDAAGRTADSDAGARATRGHGSGADVPVLRGADARNCTI